MSGLRRDEASTRADAPRSSPTTSSRGLVKVNPLATWTDLDVERLHPGPRPAGAPAGRAGLLLDRLLALHPAGRRGRGRPGRPLVRLRQDGVRPPRRVAPDHALAARIVSGCPSTRLPPPDSTGKPRSTSRRGRAIPPDAVAWLAEHLRIVPGARVADVAAGTGKLTRLLTPLGATLVGVEPVAGMRTAFVTMCPGVPLVASTAEQLPVRGVDARRDHRCAGLPLVRRAGRARPSSRACCVSGGRLGLVWNARDRTNDLVGPALVDHGPGREARAVAESTSAGATPRSSEHARVRHAASKRPSTTSSCSRRDEVIERFRSVSHVAVLPPDDQEPVLDEIRQVLDTHPLAVGREQVAIPYRVDAYWCERR